MKTKLMQIEEAINEGDKKRVLALASTLTRQDILDDLTVRGYLRPSMHCHLGKRQLALSHQKNGTCSPCFDHLAIKIIKEGNKKKVEKIIEELKKTSWS
jgi:hypothetical protein